MIMLSGVVRACVVIPATTNRKTGEVYEERKALQVEDVDDRGLVQMHTLYVPDLGPFKDKVGQKINVPVKPWARGAAVNLSYAAVQA